MKSIITQKSAGKMRNFILALILMTTTAAWAQSSSEVVNLGLYGGASRDFSWAYSTNRLFSAVETPASIFYSDDYCGNWTAPFPSDSLEYTTGVIRRGWGGGATRVLTNWNGWVAVLTAEQGGTLTSSVVSYDNGDSGTFKTIYDGYLLNQLDPDYSTNTATSAIAMSDSWIYVGLKNVLVRMNDTATYGSQNIVFDLDTSTVAGLNTDINWLAISSNTTGYPLLLVANEPNQQYGKLFSYDGTTLDEVTGIPVNYGFERVFIHPEDVSLDTIIVSAYETTIGQRKIFRSFDGGLSWTDITPGGMGTNWALQNADYNPGWEILMPQSNGLRLSFPGVDKSDDLGNTWSAHMLEDNATATHPTDTNYVVGSKNKGPQLSINGASGTFVNAVNEGHEAVSITKIAQKNTDIYYVATKAGLGYTDAYKDPTVVGVDNWRTPHGDFPISGVGTDAGVSSVAINPNDELHVIAGGTAGFYVTTTGATGFSLVTPVNWDSGAQRDFRVNDIKFITSDTIVAVTGHGDNVNLEPAYEYGHIWVSFDGGASWSKSVPTDVDGSGIPVSFKEGNAIVVGFGTADTIIYVGTGYWQDTPKDEGLLWKSEDLGISWSFVNYGPTGQNGGETHMKIYDLDVHPNPDSNQVLYIASGENLDYAFCRSIDGGTTYSYLNVSGHGAFSSVLVNKLDPEIISVSARRNLFRYNRVLASTTTVFTGLPGEFVPDLETGSTILGTTRGLFKLNETPGTITTIWNGIGDWTDVSRWSNGVPYEICNAVIESGKVTVDYNGQVYNLEAAPETSLTIASGIELNIDGDFILEADTNGYASFIDEGTLTVAGDITVQKYIAQDSWHYITPPVQGATANDFFGLYLKYWDEPTNQWIYITEPTEELLAGKGYGSWSSSGSTGDVVLSFAGTLTTGNYSPTLTLSGDPSMNYGWNLIGNGFPSAIDWGTDNDPNSDFNLTDLDNTIYFWNGTQYATYNPSGNGGDGLGTNGATRYTASAQGFYVHANAANPQITIPQSARLHHDQPFLTPQSFTDGQLKIYVNSDSYGDETVVEFNENATEGFDSQFDAYKLAGIGQAPQIYFVTASDQLAVNTLPFTGEFMSLPLYFAAGTPGNHVISVEGTEGFEAEVMISLEDQLEETITNLRQQPEYTFYGSPSDDPGRFLLHFDVSTVGTATANEEHISVYIIGDILVIQDLTGDNLQSWQLKIYNMNGSVVQSSSLASGYKSEIPVRFSNGTYAVVLSSGSRIITTKITVVR